jgi:DNA polymerase-1
MKSMLTAEERGMLTDLDRLDELVHLFKAEIKSILTELRSFKMVKKVEKILAEEKGKKYKGFNFGSHQQIARLLFKYEKEDKHQNIIKYEDGYNLKPKTISEVGNPSSKEEELIALMSNKKVGKFARTLIGLRKISKLDSTYVSGLYKHINSDERVRSNYRINGTKTGRMSSKDPNNQNIPRPEPAEYDSPLKKEVKTIYIPSKKFVFLFCDLSQAELRIMTHYSGEKTMLKWFNDGRDVHEYVAALMMGMPIAEFKLLPDYKAKRKRAKTVNFGTIYGVGKYKLAEDMSSPTEGIFYTPNEAGDFLDDYFGLFPAVKTFIEDQRRRAHEVGYVKTLFGQKRRLPDIHSDVKGIRAEAERQAVNSPIQGTSGQYTIFGMNYIEGHIDKKRRIPNDSHLINQIHDELMFEVKVKDVDKVAKIVKHSMENLPTQKYFGFQLKVPMVASVEVANKNWAHKTEIKF